MNPSKNRQKGKAFEYTVKYLAESCGLEANRIPVSGSSHGFKGDVLVSLSYLKDKGVSMTEVKGDERKLRAECKKTGKKGMRIEKAWLDKIEKEAKQFNDFPCLVIGFDRSKPYVVLSAELFFKLIR